jgi:hypothetical protein
MGTILRVGPFRVEVRSREHGVPHFHLVGPDGDASVSIHDFEILVNSGVHWQDLRRILKLLQEHRELMLEIWNENQKVSRKK